MTSSPVFDLYTVEQMQSKGERWTADYEKGYTTLRDEVVDRATRGRPMTEREYEDRLDYLHDRDTSRPVQVPLTVEELQQWRGSREAGAERAELDAYASAEGFEVRDIHNDQFDAAYEELRTDVLDRQSAGDPMSVREYRQRHESALVDAGQHWRGADWQAARADLRSIGEAPSPAMFERNPPAGQLRSIDELERAGDRFTDEYKQRYQVLCDETSSRAAEGDRMPDDELDRRLDAIYDDVRGREAAIPPALDDLREWRATPEGRAEVAELKAHSMGAEHLASHLYAENRDRPFDQQQFDDSYKKLRDDMVDRKAGGDPILAREFAQRYEDAAVDAGQSRTISSWEAERIQLRAVAAGPARDQPDRASAPEQQRNPSPRSDFESRFGHLADTPLTSSGGPGAAAGATRPTEQPLRASARERGPGIDR